MSYIIERVMPVYDFCGEIMIDSFGKIIEEKGTVLNQRGNPRRFPSRKRAEKFLNDLGHDIENDGFSIIKL